MCVFGVVTAVGCVWGEWCVGLGVGVVCGECGVVCVWCVVTAVGCGCGVW